MSNLFINGFTKQLKDKVDKDFIFGLYHTSASNKEKVELSSILKLDDVLVVDQNKKADVLKSVFNNMES